MNKAHNILNSGKDNELLKLFRDETTLIVLQVQVWNQERKEQYDIKNQERLEEEAALADPMFGLPQKEIE